MQEYKLHPAIFRFTQFHNLLSFCKFKFMNVLLENALKKKCMIDIWEREIVYCLPAVFLEKNRFHLFLFS